MLVHFPPTVPADLTGPLREMLLGHDCATNVTLAEGACLEPAGDLVECDVAREQAGELLTRRERLGVSQRRGIVGTTPTGTPFPTAHRIEATAPGHPEDAVIWDAVQEQAEAGAVATVSYLLFLVIAVSLAAKATTGKSGSKPARPTCTPTTPAGIRLDVVDSEFLYKGETIAGRFRVIRVWATQRQKWQLAAVQYTSIS